jgi:hypothetical protein
VKKTKPRKQTAGTAFFTHKRHPPVGGATQRKHAFDPFYSADRRGVFDIAKTGTFWSTLQSPLSQSGCAVAADRFALLSTPRHRWRAGLWVGLSNAGAYPKIHAFAQRRPPETPRGRLLLQMLVETTALALAGSLIGSLVGIAASLPIASQAGWSRRRQRRMTLNNSMSITPMPPA